MGMARPALQIKVKPSDRRKLKDLLDGGIQQVRVTLRAVALLQLSGGASAPRIAEVLPLTPQAIRKIGHRYEQGGFDCAIYEKARPGPAEVLDDTQKQRIIAMVCIHLDLKVETAMVKADQEALRCAFRNLLDNAIKYSPTCRSIWIDGTVDDHHIAV